jgi:hypothetical protein
MIPTRTDTNRHEPKKIHVAFSTNDTKGFMKPDTNDMEILTPYILFPNSLRSRKNRVVHVGTHKPPINIGSKPDTNPKATVSDRVRPCRISLLCIRPVPLMVLSRFPGDLRFRAGIVKASGKPLIKGGMMMLNEFGRKMVDSRVWR